uniref:ABC transporter domain-containing protein n=1 Tax=Sus scrofa TaxID=9823 RepID=A0A8D1U7P5_PIG
MDFSWFYKFMVLLWKNFVLKRRRFIALIMEIILTLLFIGTLLLTRNFVVIRNYGPFNYSLQPVDELPAFLGNIPFPGLWELAFVPSKSVVVKNIVETVKRDLHYNFKVQGFSSERDFENYVKKKVNSKKVMAAFVFDHEFQNSHDPLPLKVKYHLRFSSFQRNKDVRFDRNRGWETGALFPAFPSVGPRNEDFENGGSPGYITEGFLVMQHALDKAIMAYHARVAVQNLFTNVTVFVQRFPYPEYYHDFFLEMLDIFTPLVILFIFAMNHLILVQSIVWEKENRLKVTPLSWCCTTINIIKILQLLKIFYIEPVPVIQHSDPSLVFVFLLCYAIATICFSFMVSTFFNKVYFSVSVGGFIYLATYFPATSFFSNYAQMTLTQKLASCFSSNIAMSLGTKFLVKAEMDKIGIKWSNIFSPTKLDNFVFAYILGMFLFDAFLYGLVAWYIEAVFPGEYGVSKPWNFFLLVIMAFLFPSYKYFEAEPPDLVAGIQIKHMCKEFRVKNTIKTAVKDLSLNLFEGQITVLVGHNGAGKSTTLSILSGLYLLTSGEAYVNGYDVSKQMGQIRKSLGLCPQQDLLFNYLTVSEHLYFYSVIKGIPQKMRLIEINNMLSTFNLLEKHNAFSVSLSGGMKRKLSIIIALIGGSKVVILDEPTSGMDPASRRATWNLLQHYKQDRTILLTTHDVDEADLLGDRIAIMVNGSLRCCGSSIFLKKIYGVGYHIDIVKEPHCDVEEIAKIIYYHIPTATLEKNARNELSFILPKDYTHRFETLFTDLEKRRKELGIASFGASITTMEEVFLRVSNMEDSPTDIQATQPHPPSTVSIKNQNRNMSRNERADSSAMNESPAVMFNTGYSLYQQQFCAMFIKKAIFSWRNWKLILILILAFLGSLIFLLSEGAIFSNNNDNEKARQMDLGQYGPTIVPVSISGDSNLTLAFLQHLKSMLEPEKQTLKEVQGDLLKYLMENKDCIQSCIVAFSIVVKTNTTIFTALFNNQAYHSPSLTLAMLDNILFKSVSGPNASLTVSNKPQPSPAYNEPRISGHQMALNVHFGMALLISSFCLQTVTERVSKAKHIQFVSGVYVLVYWLSALLWDFTIFFITCCLLLVMFKYGRLDIYITDYRFLDTMLIFLLYGWSAIPLMYLLSFLFTRSTSAYIILVLFNYLSGIFTLLIDDSFQLGLIHGVNFLQKKMSFFFPFSDNTKNVYSLEEETIGKYMIMMSITGFVFLLIIFFLETTLWRLRTFFHQYIYFVIYKAFKKVYFKYPVIFAVKNISLAIQKGECFGLLGFNGAGKTTTFKLLTGDEIVTSGKVFIDGFSITENTQKVKSRIGYCPQSDALLEYMTGREIMIMYARLWGISEPQIQQYVDKWLNSLQLEPHADKLISTYSGGNKRQLSTAIALMGKPSVILLDEPTTGMDPVAQRLLWDAVTWARESGKAIVISSHRMEECDAFCTRLAIMVQGKFMCLGNPQHLKSKFGNIYILNIKAKIYTHEDKLDDLKFFITMTFPGSVLKHENQGILHYYIPSKDNTWGKVFGILEEAKEQYNLEDYSISQITLEQVFLTFANPTEPRKRDG